MTEEKAKKLVEVLNFFSNENYCYCWESEASNYFEKEWKVEVRLTNSAYRHELNALMMLINNNVTSAVYPEVDDNQKIYWKIW